MEVLRILTSNLLKFHAVEMFAVVGPTILRRTRPFQIPRTKFQADVLGVKDSADVLMRYYHPPRGPPLPGEVLQ